MSNWRLYAEHSSHNAGGFQESFHFEFPNSLSTGTNELDNMLPEGGWPVGELSEIKCSDFEAGLQLLLPVISQLNAQNRWITLISPPSSIDQKLFSYYGVDMSRVLLIHPKNDVDDQITMNKALKNGMSGVVILWTANLNSRYLAQWRKSVKQGNSTGLIINRSETSHASRSVALTVETAISGNDIVFSQTKFYGKKIKPATEVRLPKVCFEAVMDNYLSSRHSFRLVS